MPSTKDTAKQIVDHLPSPAPDKVQILAVIHGSRNLAAKEAKPWNVV